MKQCIGALLHNYCEPLSKKVELSCLLFWMTPYSGDNYMFKSSYHKIHCYLQNVCFPQYFILNTAPMIWSHTKNCILVPANIIEVIRMNPV